MIVYKLALLRLFIHGKVCDLDDGRRQSIVKGNISIEDFHLHLHLHTLYIRHCYTQHVRHETIAAVRRLPR